MFGPKHVRIIKHHRNAAVYQDGRYLHVDMKISTRSKKGRQIARETAMAILGEVHLNEDAHDLPAGFEDGKSGLGHIVQDSPPQPPDSFIKEEGATPVSLAAAGGTPEPDRVPTS